LAREHKRHDYWRLKAIDELELAEQDMPKEEYHKIIDLLIDNKKVREGLIHKSLVSPIWKFRHLMNYTIKKENVDWLVRVYLNENQDNLRDEHGHYVDFLTRRHHADFLTRPQYYVDFHYNQAAVLQRLMELQIQQRLLKRGQRT
jgi:hypothetical protein